MSTTSAHVRAALGMGRVFQDARLFPSLTVAEVIAVAFERHIRVRDPILCLAGTASARRSEAEVADGVEIVAVDLQPLDGALAAKCAVTAVGDILNARLLENLSTAHNFAVIYHLAALLSTRAERQPVLAHRVNIDGTRNLLEIAISQSRLQGGGIKLV